MKRETFNYSCDSIIIKPGRPEFLARAEEIAARFGAKVNTDYQNAAEIHALTGDALEEMVVLITHAGVSVRMGRDNHEKPVFIDFTDGAVRYRQKNSSTRKEAIARAVGLKSGQDIAILDATGGLGRDSFILASLGAMVTTLERNALVHLLLEDAIARAKVDMTLVEIMKRINLIHTDAISFLEKELGVYDVIYMDPMFPNKTKSALNKKEMRLFRKVVGDDDDIEILFEKAFSKAKKRVVVKRPLRAPHINSKKPGFEIKGSSSRFDVYMVL